MEKFMVIDMMRLAGKGLHFGGEVDENGNFFREKDVLNNDYSEPTLTTGIYPTMVNLTVTMEKGRPTNRYYRAHIFEKMGLLDVTLPKASLLLSEDEYKAAVRPLNDEEKAKMVVAELKAMKLTDSVYRILKEEYVYQDAYEYIWENNFDDKAELSEEEEAHADRLAHKIARRYVFDGDYNSNLGHEENIKNLLEKITVEEASDNER